ncbi:unannotated protein [freshwater metagenome]|uniref:Unannotated protein n=1 Tax=freshwater metagenome TaxID=449393 RepID=A0A6J7E6Y8_9ZZZZ
MSPPDIDGPSLAKPARFLARRVHVAHPGSDHRRVAARGGPRTPPFHRGPRHGPHHPDRCRGRAGPGGPHCARLSVAQRDPEAGHRCRATACRGSLGVARLHRDDRRRARERPPDDDGRPGINGWLTTRPRTCPGPGDPLCPAGIPDAAAADRVGQGRCRQVERHDEPCGGACTERLQRRRRGCRYLRVLHSADARGQRRSRGDRPDAHPVRGMGRSLHFDRLLRARGAGSHLAWADAAQGARAVPHRRVLGRARLPAHRHAARYG